MSNRYDNHLASNYANVKSLLADRAIAMLSLRLTPQGSCFVRTVHCELNDWDNS